jgi:hypothetical protein
MLVIVKSHENPMFDAQNPWKSHKTSGSKNQIWDGWTLLLTLDRPDGAQTVATENRQGTLLWRTMSLGNLRGRSVFSFFLGTHQSLAGLKWCETHRWSFLDTAFSSVFFLMHLCWKSAFLVHPETGLKSMKSLGLPHYGAIRRMADFIFFLFDFFRCFYVCPPTDMEHPTIFVQKMFLPSGNFT